MQFAPSLACLHQQQVQHNYHSIQVYISQTLYGVYCQGLVLRRLFAVD